MAQKSGNNVPVPSKEKPHSAGTIRQDEDVTDQHHGESTKSPQDDRRIGQHNAAGRPPLMKK